MDESRIILYQCYALLFVAPFVFGGLMYKFHSPYGRYVASADDGAKSSDEDETADQEKCCDETTMEKETKSLLASASTLPPRTAWVLMESPSFYVTAAAFYGFGSDNVRSRPVNNVLVCLMLAHYLQRSFVYSLLIRGGKPFPLSSFLSAFSFCAFNGYLQGRSLSSNTYPPDWFADPRFVVGAALFILGAIVNVHSDSVLRNLREPGETGYKIPYGGAFRYVSAANLLGEIVEWCGFALACWSLPALSFAIFTAANLVPRGWQHHQWYKKRFGAEYPAERRAIIPFLL